MKRMEMMKQFAIMLVVVGLTLTIGLKVTSNVGNNMVLDSVVTDEQASPATPLPTNYTVGEASKSTFRNVVDESETLVWYDSSSGTNTTLTSGTDYVSYYDVGKFEVQSSTTLSDYNTTEDTIYVDYTAELDDTTAQKGAQNATEGLNEISSFLPIIGLVVAAIIVIGLVSGGFGGRSMKRGRA